MDEMQERKLVIPSDPSKVTVENLWRVLNVIVKIGRTFQNEDIAKHPDSPYTDKIALGRILSYLKYLGVITESRERSQMKEGKPEIVQKFKVTDAASKLYYFLQDGRRDDAMSEWANLIKSHVLFRSIRDELLSSSSKTTIRELQDAVWRAYGGKHQSTFYRNGAEFIAELLDNAGLVEFNRSSGLVSLIERPGKEEPVEEVVSTPRPTRGPPVGPDFVEFSYEGLYLKIKPDPVKIELAKGILELLEKQIQAKKTSNSTLEESK